MGRSQEKLENITYQEKLENIMDHVQESGLYVNTFSDIIIGQSSEVPIDANNRSSMILPEEKCYNSIMLFTVLTCLMKKGSLMYTGGPGIGKTTAAEYISHFVLDLPLKEILDAEIQCHPEQTEEKMTARLHTGKLVTSGEESVRWRKWGKCPIHILNEVNRLPADKTDILYEALDRWRITYADESTEMAEGPILATANYKDAGNFIMTPPFLDRFSVAVRVPKPNALDLELITDRPSTNLGGSIEDRLTVTEDMKLTAEDIVKIRSQIKAIKMEKEARNYIHYLCSQIDFCMQGASSKYNRFAPAFMNKGSCENKQPDALCKDCHYKGTDLACRLTKNELTVRTALATYDYSKALSWMLEKDSVTVEIVKEIFPYMTWHKLEPTQTALKEDPAFVNDRIGLMRFIMEKSEDGFRKAVAKDGIFENYGAIVNAFEKVGKGEMTAQDLLEKVEKHGLQELSQNEDPVKFALACWLQKIHHYIKVKYKVTSSKKK